MGSLSQTAGRTSLSQTAGRRRRLVLVKQNEISDTTAAGGALSWV